MTEVPKVASYGHVGTGEGGGGVVAAEVLFDAEADQQQAGDHCERQQNPQDGAEQVDPEVAA